MRQWAHIPWVGLQVQTGKCRGGEKRALSLPHSPVYACYTDYPWGTGEKKTTSFMRSVQHLSPLPERLGSTFKFMLIYCTVCGLGYSTKFARSTWLAQLTSANRFSYWRGVKRVIVFHRFWHWRNRWRLEGCSTRWTSRYFSVRIFRQDICEEKRSFQVRKHAISQPLVQAGCISLANGLVSHEALRNVS